jgi:nicotinate-nucleotide adenylyltransferase
MSLEEKYKGRLEGKIGLVIGGDLADGFLSWKDPDKIAETADIVIANRPGSPVGDFPYPCQRLSNPLLTISSSDIRSNIASLKSWRYLVPDAVYRYIVKQRLYEN